MRLGRNVALGASVLLVMLGGGSCFGDDESPRAKGNGRVAIVYQDDAIQSENLDAIKKIRDSRVFRTDGGPADGGGGAAA